MSDGTYSYRYDDEGNRIKRTDLTTGATVEYVWDHRNRLSEVLEKNASGVLVERAVYTYDSSNHRVSKTVFVGAGQSLLLEEWYLYDGDQMLAVLGAGGAALTSYLAVGGTVYAQTRDGYQSEWLLHDQLGSVRQVVDGSGTLVASYLYDAYGNPTQASGDAGAARFRWTGLEYDPETGNYYAWHRYYDPATGRWLSVDWIEDNLNNFYGYVGNNPTNFTDLNGLEQMTLFDGNGQGIEVDTSNSEQLKAALMQAQRTGGARTAFTGLGRDPQVGYSVSGMKDGVHLNVQLGKIDYLFSAPDIVFKGATPTDFSVRDAIAGQVFADPPRSGMLSRSLGKVAENNKDNPFVHAPAGMASGMATLLDGTVFSGWFRSGQDAKQKCLDRMNAPNASWFDKATGGIAYGLATLGQLFGLYGQAVAVDAPFHCVNQLLPVPKVPYGRVQLKSFDDIVAAPGHLYGKSAGPCRTIARFLA